MDASFASLVNELHAKYLELMRMVPVTVATVPMATPTGGVYLFSENGRAPLCRPDEEIHRAADQGPCQARARLSLCVAFGARGDRPDHCLIPPREVSPQRHDHVGQVRPSLDPHGSSAGWRGRGYAFSPRTTSSGASPHGIMLEFAWSLYR